MIKFKRLKILGIFITMISYKEMLEYIEISIEENQKKVISYATFHTINFANKSKILATKINSFDIIHADGIGVYFASKFLYGNGGFINKITGSDFYPLFIDHSIKNGWSLFFFGDKKDTLEKIQVKNPELRIAGIKDGYDFNDNEVITEINSSDVDVLIIGLGCPLQENWVYKNKEFIDVKVILIVGDGIKVFAGTKNRGNKFFQKIGAEWLYRLIINPRSMWKRYLIGIPLFLFRILKYKFINGKLG